MEPVPNELDSRPLRPLTIRQWEEGAIGMPGDSVLLSFKVAATAAAALAAAVVVTLFRRVTRWLELTAPREIECE